MTTTINDTPESSSVPVESAFRSHLRNLVTEWFEKHIRDTTLPSDASVDAHLVLNERLKDYLARNFSEQWRFLGLQPCNYFELQSLAPDIRAANHRDKFPRERFAHTNSVDRAIKLLEYAESEFQVQGLYIIPQVINSAIVAKASPHEWHVVEKGTGTKSADIKAFLTVYADFDAEREGGAKAVSATDEEMRLAVERGTVFFLDVAEILGNADSLAFLFSGNGPQIHLALDHLPVTKEIISLREEFVQVVALLYGDDQVHGDVAVSDPKRLTPAVGTYKRKGYNSREFGRLHRVTAILVSERIHRLTETELRALVDHFKSRLTAEQAATLKKKESPSVPKSSASVGHSKSKQDGPSPFEAANALPIREVAALLGMDVENPRCPVCVDTEGGVDFLDDKNGTNYLKCQHSSCGASLWGPVDLVVKLALGLDRYDKEAAKQAVEWLAERFPGQVPSFGRVRRKRVVAASPGTDNPDACANSSDDSLPTIQLGPLVDEVVQEAVAALAADLDIYVRGGNLVKILPDEEAGIPRIDVATPSVITNVHLSRSANWVRFDERKKTMVSCPPPSHVGLTVRDLGLWPGIRRLNGVITTPMLRADGTVLSTPGYDNQTGLYLHPTVDIDPVPDVPSATEIENAKSRTAGDNRRLSICSVRGRSLAVVACRLLWPAALRWSISGSCH